MHLNGTKTSLWIGVVFTFADHGTSHLSFHLKLEGINVVDDNLKVLNIIGGTNMIIRKFNNLLSCPKQCLIRYMDILQLDL